MVFLADVTHVSICLVSIFIPCAQGMGILVAPGFRLASSHFLWVQKLKTSGPIIFILYMY